MNLRLEFRTSAAVLILALFVVTIDRLGWQAGMMATVLIILSLLAHEAGHIVVAACFGVQVKSVGLCVLGAFIRREHSHRPRAEAAIAMAGPMVNLALAIMFAGSAQTSFVAAMNALTFLANALPVPGCDGWRALQSLRQAWFPQSCSRRAGS